MASPLFAEYQKLFEQQCRARAAQVPPPPSAPVGSGGDPGGPGTPGASGSDGGENIPTPMDADLEDISDEGIDKLIEAARSEEDNKRAFGDLLEQLGVQAKKQKCG
eukprot:942732-Pyramimonas_sp.AAC.1